MKYIVLASMLLIAACAKPKPEDDPDLRGAFADKVKDPASLQFKDMHANDSIICGESNSKNGFGAYAGYTAFVFLRGEKTLLLEDTDEQDAAGIKTFGEAMEKCPDASDLQLRHLDRTTERVIVNLKAVSR